ncbi:hypothetical protein BDP27DRAFT_1357320 [Rhodocollybia butyracea]|uniref:Uncharacterized protein n=1 Tax=Rhodocollybia butyracea TaxID=206335 RepID=A0A9P5Q7Y6_9AGAR|nr:hypothetical protein BDP27DRAFT_1357320 [Rhodocollybia butyracea]
MDDLGPKTLECSLTNTVASARRPVGSRVHRWDAQHSAVISQSEPQYYLAEASKLQKASLLVKLFREGSPSRNGSFGLNSIHICASRQFHNVAGKNNSFGGKNKEQRIQTAESNSYKDERSWIEGEQKNIKDTQGLEDGGMGVSTAAHCIQRGFFAGGPRESKEVGIDYKDEAERQKTPAVMENKTTVKPNPPFTGTWD